MIDQPKKRRLIFKFISILGFIAILYGLVLYFLDDTYKTTSLELVVVGLVSIILVAIIAPILDPISTRGVKRQKKLQKGNVSKFSKNRGPAIVTHAFDKYIQHYPEAMKNYPERVPSSIEYAKRDNEFTTVIYKGREYVFYFKVFEGLQGNSDSPRTARLQLYKNSRRRLDMTLKEGMTNRYLPYWQPEDIRYLDYGHGTWLKDMKNLIKDARRIARYYIWNS